MFTSRVSALISASLLQVRSLTHNPFSVFSLISHLNSFSFFP